MRRSITGECRTDKDGENSSTEDGEGQRSGSEHEYVGQASQTVRAGQGCINGGIGERRTGEFVYRECIGEDEGGTDNET